MTARRIQAPIWVIECQWVDCDAAHQSDGWWAGGEHRARIAAGEAGWQVRPARGRGSRSAPEFCPTHRTDGGAS